MGVQPTAQPLPQRRVRAVLVPSEPVAQHVGKLPAVVFQSAAAGRAGPGSSSPRARGFRHRGSRLPHPTPLRIASSEKVARANRPAAASACRALSSKPRTLRANSHCSVRSARLGSLRLGSRPDFHSPVRQRRVLLVARPVGSRPRLRANGWPSSNSSTVRRTSATNGRFLVSQSSSAPASSGFSASLISAVSATADWVLTREQHPAILRREHAE